jgi:dihydroorotate dehydrogenase
MKCIGNKRVEKNGGIEGGGARPAVIETTAKGIQVYLKRKGVKSVRELVGRAVA